MNVGKSVFKLLRVNGWTDDSLVKITSWRISPHLNSPLLTLDYTCQPVKAHPQEVVKLHLFEPTKPLSLKIFAS